MSPPKRDNYTFANQSSIPAPFSTQLPAFFRSWDDPHSKDSHAYLQLFAPEGTLAFGPTPTHGRDNIRAFRAAMVDPVRGPVVDLQHTLDRFFLLVDKDDGKKKEVIVNGSIWYRLRNGRRIDADFASWMVFGGGGGGGGGEQQEPNSPLQADFYEVYLDSLELMGAIKEMNDADAGANTNSNGEAKD